MYIGIICEFDPLHSGHARLLSHARAMGADAVVNIRYASSAVMQGAAEVMAYGTAVKFVE